jgi:transketolase
VRKTCLDEIHRLAQRDPRVLFFGSDIGAGTLDRFKAEFPARFFMEGVSEANIVGVMSGLAMNGWIPYLNTIAVFLTRRCYEQVLLDAAMHHLPIRLVGSGGGLVYAPLGATHLAFEDMALMRAIPHMAVVAVCDAEEMKRLMPQTLDWPGPLYIRLAKGGDPVVSDPALPFRIGQAIVRQQGNDALLITTGITLKIAMEAAGILANDGVSTTILHMHTVKPLDVDSLLKHAEPVRAVVTVEEHTLVGGLGSAVTEVLAEADMLASRRMRRIGLPDLFPSLYGSQALQLKEYGVTALRIADTVRGLLDNRPTTTR